jgi:hypothetical protein
VAAAPSPDRLAGFAPAGVGLALLVAITQVRMNGPWSDAALVAAAAVPAVLLLALGVRAGSGREQSHDAVTVLLVAGLVLAAAALGRLGDALAGEDFLEHGGTLTWMLAAFTALAAVCTRRTGSAACLLLAALAAVGLLLEFVNWAFGTEALGTFRALLAVSFAVLFVAGLVVGGRAGTVLIGAAGVTVLAATYVTGAALLFAVGSDVPWGWELVTLLEGLALATYAVQRLEPGPGYLAFFVLLSFAGTAALGGGTEDGEPSQTLVGWPLALAIGTVAAALPAVRRTTRRI